MLENWENLRKIGASKFAAQRKIKNIELQRCILYIYQDQFKNKIKNISARFGEILRTTSLGRDLLVLVKKECNAG